MFGCFLKEGMVISLKTLFCIYGPKSKSYSSVEIFKKNGKQICWLNGESELKLGSIVVNEHLACTLASFLAETHGLKSEIVVPWEKTSTETGEDRVFKISFVFKK